MTSLPPPVGDARLFFFFTLRNINNGSAAAQFNLSHVYMARFCLLAGYDCVQLMTEWTTYFRYRFQEILFILFLLRQQQEQHIIKGDESAYFLAIRFPDFKNAPTVLYVLFYFFLIFLLPFFYFIPVLCCWTGFNSERERLVVPSIAPRLYQRTYTLLNI